MITQELLVINFRHLSLITILKYTFISGTLTRKLLIKNYKKNTYQYRKKIQDF